MIFCLFHHNGVCCPLFAVQHTTAKHALMDLRFYLEIPWPQHMSTQTPSRNDINLFFKYYDAEAETLRYVGHRYVPRNMKVRSVWCPGLYFVEVSCLCTQRLRHLPGQEP